MNSKAKNILKSFSYTLTSNLLSTLISVIVILVIPQIIGVEAYGYWQLYLFYTAYIGLFHFGWNDGIYLRYGGKEYDQLDKNLFFSQYYMLIALQIILSSIIYFSSSSFIINDSKIFVIKATAISMVIINVRYMLIYILQSTNRFKEYALITITDRVFYFIFVILLLIMKFNNYELLVIVDIGGKIISLIYAMYCCKDIAYRKVSDFYFSFRESFENIRVGIKLLFSNFASLLIVGLVRLGIERSWDVSTFGKISLTLSITNFMMIFINAMGIILFPILRRTHTEKLSEIYIVLRQVIIIVMFGFLLFYYPLKFFVSMWLPDYSEGLKYMVFIFPICIFEGKMALLLNTFLKTLRKEKIMLKINLVSVFFSAIMTVISTYILENLNMAVISIIFVLILRSTLAEYYLSKTLGLSLIKDIAIEILLTLVFILAGSMLSFIMSAIVYLLAYILFLSINLRQTKYAIKMLNILLKN